MTDLIAQSIEQFLATHGWLGLGKAPHFVVAFSGGQDSTTLLQALVATLKTHNQAGKITVAYYWHPWRPLQDDLAIVHQHVKRLNLPWVMLTPDLTLPQSETAARTDRYQQLANLANDLSADGVLTAHHLDDQIETILFRMLRGTGLEGMLGIPEERILEHNIPVFRPLLHISRRDIEAYIQLNQLPYVTDPTNANTQFKRNFIRHEVLPVLQKGFPNVRESLLHLSEIVSGDLSIIQTKMAEVWLKVYDSATNSLNETLFNQLSRAFQRRVLRQFLQQHAMDCSLHRIEELIDFIAGKGRTLNKPSLYSLDTKQFLALYRNRITVESPQKSQIDAVPIHLPGAVSHVALKTSISIKPIPPDQRPKQIDYQKLPKNQVYVDLSRLENPELTLRTRQEGDKIKPLGMSTPMKLKRFLINRAIPRFNRDSLPLLVNGQNVLWVVGVGISEDIRVKTHPTHIITVQQG